MEDRSSLPFLAEPHDTLRLGLPSLKSDASVSHPLEMAQVEEPKQREKLKQQMLSDVYGTALPARMHIERQILSRVQRLPGLPSSRLGLDSITGKLDNFTFESYLNRPEESEEQQPDLHAQMEAQLRISAKPQTRGFF